MMTKALSAYRIIAAAAGLLLFQLPSIAAQNPTVATPPKAAETVNQDSASWRREPFLGNAKKGERLTNAKAPPTARFGALPQKQDSEHDINLQGIMQAGKAFHALINGRSVKEGDTIGGVTIKHINRYQVVVLNERKEKVIYDIYQGRIDRGKK